MPTRHFLRNLDPLSQQVAQWVRGVESKGSLLITPTSGAARRVAERIKSYGAKPPPSSQPMQALLPERANIGSPVERCLAWAEALRRATSADLKTLFWKEKPESLAELLKAGRNFNSLCDLLAEAGLHPSILKFPTQQHMGFDEGRWAAVASLYQNYLEILSQWQLCDPNALRLEQIAAPTLNIGRLIIAAVPDLPLAFERYAQSLENKGTQVDLLIWNPGGTDEDHFDDWGRPLPDAWNTRVIPLKERQIHVAASARDEAHRAVTVAQQAPSSIVLADPRLSSLLASEITSNGGQPYLPEGQRLICCEAAKIALEWEAFRQSQDLRRLRRLLELPAFCRALNTENPISQSDALIAIDHLLGKTIATSLSAAWLAHSHSDVEATPSELTLRPKIRRLLDSVRSRLQTSALQWIELADSYNNSGLSESSKKTIEIGRHLEGSPALKNWLDGGQVPAQIWAQAIQSQRLQTPAEGDATTLNGWLEAPWLSEKRLVLCGLIEGRLPQTIDGDPFLPDSIRSKLGLSDNAQRLARDAYLLSALIASYPEDQLHLSYSKYNASGDPNKPSRLLLSTSLKDLPSRVRYVTKAKESTRTRPRRQNNWRWQLKGDVPKVTKISPTHFESYLACPFRFFLGKVLGCESAPLASYEMDASVFGNLIHRTLENFGREIIPLGKAMLQLDEPTIWERVQKLLDQVAHLQFGTQPAPAVQVQLANAAARLHAFARVQAKCFADGWIILDVERKLEAHGDGSLTIGSLQLSGIIDRIEQHSETQVLRVVDYKTYSSVKKPAEAHFAPASHNWFPAALVELATGKHSSSKTWKNLQLPIYRMILEHWYPRECAAQRPELAYFQLPSDPYESGIYHFDELSDALYTSAVECAEAVTQNINDGIFWPPQNFRGSWSDPVAPLFVNGAPEDCVATDTIERLKGTRR